MFVQLSIKIGLYKIVFFLAVYASRMRPFRLKDEVHKNAQGRTGTPVQMEDEKQNNN